MDEGSASSLSRCGIYINGGNGNDITYNKINDPNIAFGSYDPCIPTTDCDLDDKIALTILDSYDSKVTCNRTHATEIGIQFIASTNDFDLSASVRGNTFQWHYDGLTIGGNGQSGTIIGTQSFPGGTPGNYWKGYNSTGDFGGTGHGAIHTFDTDNDNLQFKVNDDADATNNPDGLYYPKTNVATGTGGLTIFEVIAPPFGCAYGEPQDLRITEDSLKISLSKCCSISPNPANKFVNFTYSLDESNYSIFLLDLAGKKLSCTEVAWGSGVEMIDLEHFPAGLYFVKLVADGKIEFMSKVIKVQ